MEKKRRPFSGFDVVVVALVVLAAGVWIWNSNRGVEEESAFYGDHAIYHIEVRELTREQAGQIQVGDLLQEGSRHLAIGQVISVSILPFETRVEDWETQTVFFDEVPERYTVIITMETLVEETDRAVLTEGGFAIRGGSSLNFTGPGYAFSGATILSIERRA